MKRAIVLAGGGSRGAYQIGVWEALRDLNLDYHIVTGTSVGAINAALMVQNNFEQAREIWSSLEINNVLDLELPNLDLTKKEDMLTLFNSMFKESMSKGGTGLNALGETMKHYIDEDLFFASEVDFGLITVKYPNFKAVSMKKADVPKGKLIEYLLASSALYPVFNKKVVDDEIYIDGGFHDNMPINLALEMGAKDIIAVSLNSIPKGKKVRNTHNAMIRYIKPYLPLGSLVKFDKTITSRNMRLGYLDTMKTLGGYEGLGYTFYFGENNKNSRVLGTILQERMNLFAGTNRKVLNAFALKRIYKMFDMGKSSGDYLDILPVAAQYGGEFFGLDDTQVYTYEKFNVELLQAYNSWMKKSKQVAPIYNIADGVSVIRKKLQLLDRRSIIGFIVEVIEESYKNKAIHFDLQALMVGFGKEALVAFYLNCLINSYFL